MDAAKTFTGTIAKPGLTLHFHDRQTMATISHDGKVAINWERVDNAVNNPDDADPTLLAYARLMTAIRDKTFTAL